MKILEKCIWGVAFLALCGLLFVVYLTLNDNSAENAPTLTDTVTVLSTGAVVVATLVLAAATFRIVSSDRERERSVRWMRLHNG